MRSCTVLLFTSLLCLPAASAETIHVLQRGETLYSLARNYGVSLDEILSSNGITDPSALSVGMRLVIPETDDETTLAHRDSAVHSIHEVAKGETYYSIARRYGTAVDRLLELNGRTGDQILNVGDRLKVSSTFPESTALSLGVEDPSAFPPSSSNDGGRAAVRVQDVPWWPVAGIKRPLEGKLAGVSIEADSMSYVHAVATGNVVWTGPYRGFGNVVLIDSGGYIYLYGGNEDLFVNVGQWVSAGNRIGRLGSSGPNGGHKEMYFSVFREGVPVSPDGVPRG